MEVPVDVGVVSGLLAGVVISVNVEGPVTSVPIPELPDFVVIFPEITRILLFNSIAGLPVGVSVIVVVEESPPPQPQSMNPSARNMARAMSKMTTMTMTIMQQHVQHPFPFSGAGPIKQVYW